jgi:putative spermidine/putrescine transport system permease protein
MTESRTWRVTRGLLLLLYAVFFIVPLYAMIDYSTQGVGGGRSAEAWTALFTEPTLTSAIITSLLLALLSVGGMLVLLVPTMVWVRLRVPRATRLVEFLCLLPLTIPALVIVVGMRNVYTWVNYFIGDSALTLAFIYVVLVLPYAYRAIDSALSSLDVVTLAEAARSLGASWVTVILRIVVPNIGSGLLGAAFISVALVMGEYTIASLTNYDTLQVVIVAFSKSEPRTSVAASLAVLVFVFALLMALSYVGRDRRRISEGN